MQQFLKDLKAGKTRWNQAKVVICGKEGAGKTHLTRRLMREDYEMNKSTDGINVDTIEDVRAKASKGPPLTFCVYDLGGASIAFVTS